ncbi:MAG: glucokinase [Thiohalomonadales bacterium]
MSMSMSTVLAADIGGTKTILQLIKVEDNCSHCMAESRYDSQGANSFDDLLDVFLRENNYHGALDIMCIGVAGPVSGESAKVTNLPWHLKTTDIAEAFSINRVVLINDFQAIGYGIDSLQKDDLFVVQAGLPIETGVRAIIGAGTGLGEGFMIWHNDRYKVYPSEGGHVSFSPTNRVQIELLQFLQSSYAQVAFEEVLSGPGLENIYSYINSRKDVGLPKKYSAAEITRLAYEVQETNAKEALDIFLSIYGAQAGNLALTVMATGGLYIAGGVAPRIKQSFLDGPFLAAFTQKSKMESLMPQFPVMIVDNPKVGLLGARNLACHLAV